MVIFILFCSLTLLGCALNNNLQEVDAELPQLLSLIVWKDGEILHEKYFHGHSENQALNIWSTTKSVTSLITGIAIDKGFITSVDDKIVDYLNIQSGIKYNQELDQVTIRHCLTMTTGLRPDFDNQISLQMLTNTEFLYQPGEVFQYSNSDPNLLSAVLEKATGKKMDEFAFSYLLSLLDIERPIWDQNYEFTLGADGLYLRARDMLKIGQLVLNRGFWEEERIVSSEWIDESTQGHILGSEGRMYGYLWWKERPADRSDREDLEMIRALGHGGQFVYIVLAHNLVIVTQADVMKRTEENIIYLQDFLQEEIVMRYCK